LLYLWGRDVFITEACHKPDHEESLPSLFWMPDWEPGQELGPAQCCKTCAANLRKWLSRKRRSMSFAIPMLWREQTNRISDCYFCMVPPPARFFEEEKVDLTLSEYTICYADSTLRWKTSRSGHPEIVTLESEKEEDDEICDISEPST
jgi:hypothetical protein